MNHEIKKDKIKAKQSREDRDQKALLIQTKSQIKSPSVVIWL
uniref:Uncharacterized protein n=1 Tax=Rhizophora mucronata TaxID=61149 RepID=A0A2P2Q1G1_RHIMU